MAGGEGTGKGAPGPGPSPGPSKALSTQRLLELVPGLKIPRRLQRELLAPSSDLYRQLMQQVGGAAPAAAWARSASAARPQTPNEPTPAGPQVDPAWRGAAAAAAAPEVYLVTRACAPDWSGVPAAARLEAEALFSYHEDMLVPKQDRLTVVAQLVALGAPALPGRGVARREGRLRARATSPPLGPALRALAADDADGGRWRLRA